ncbi:Nucleolar protein 16 [Alternaria rosae]|uniref:ribosome biogenesis protein Nop16 n=1 Tax=Alternaria rosae TaxID=1187941 RepID=UPI001E8D96E0|nr:ribosome biogenesis protein Nop16 [Alternaria rosae]KAH6882469.1 ribosome biogenesis protein Nop16 [Alternaria rosae]KAI4951948.1 Nucleolar protein 16 [Alternaria rosae]
MGRELQKKKNRSSIPKKRKNGPSKKKILQNPIIAKHWNQKETLSQNYRRLGLTARLNHATGGTEKTIALLGLNDEKSSRADTAANSTADALNIVSKAKKPENIAIEEIEVERDPETGAILNVTGTLDKKDNPLNDPLNEIEDDDEEMEWNGFSMVPERPEEAQNPVIRELEEAAMNGARKAPRGQSQREQEWVERLVNKYGEDYAKMARDRKLNPMQQTAADIKKRVAKWQKAQNKA